MRFHQNMHILETYALNCGAKIGKPYIYPTFFPLPVEKFITFTPDEAEPAKNYEYWQDVINILNPILLKQGVRIIQIGDAKDRAFSECVNIKGQTTHNQWAYLIQRSLLHFGADGFAAQLAGSFDIPVVTLHSVSYVGVSKPYFGSPHKQVAFAGYDRAKLKPSQAAEENPKTVNLINPEEIAQSILNLLEIKENIAFETVFTGKKYSNFVIEESIPDSPQILFNPEHQVEIRADLGFEENSFIQQLGNYKKAIVVLDKPVNMNILRRLKQNIISVVFKVSDETHYSFLTQLLELGRPVILISTLPEERIQQLRLIYYEFGNINKIESAPEDKINELKKEASNLFYRSAKITSSKGKYFYSYAATERDIPMKNHFEYQRVLDIPSFWENLHCFTIVRPKSSLT